MQGPVIVDILAAAICLAIALELFSRRGKGVERTLVALMAVGIGAITTGLAVVRTEKDLSSAFLGFALAAIGSALLVAAQIGLGATLASPRRARWAGRLTLWTAAMLLSAAVGVAALCPDELLAPTVLEFDIQSDAIRAVHVALFGLGALALVIGPLLGMRRARPFTRRRLAAILAVQVAVAAFFLLQRNFASPAVFHRTLPAVLLGTVAAFAWVLRHFRIGGPSSQVILGLFDRSPHPAVFFDFEAEEALLNPAAREVLGHIEPRPDRLVQALGLGEHARDVLSGPTRRVSVRLGPAGARVFDLQTVDDPREKSGLLLLQEVTERAVQLEEALARIQKSRERMLVQEKMAAIGFLVGGIAHEVNNPLGFLKANLEVLEQHFAAITRWLLDRSALQTSAEYPEVSEAMAEAPDLFTECRAGCDRIGKLVSALTTMSRKSEETRSTDLAQLGREAVEIVRPRFERGPRFEVNLPDALPVAGIPHALSQALIHLVQNAAEAAGENGTVTVTGWSRDDSVVVEVADDGPGIAHDIKTRIFDPFFTTRPLTEKLGLGLTFAYEVAMVHCGELAVESEVGGGARFQLRIPVESAC